MTPAERVLSRCIESEDGCLIFTGAISDRGYGRIRVDGKNRSAHRVVYEALVGPIPEGLVIDHLCRVRACQNHEHMEPVTSAENTRRGIHNTYWSDKVECPRGHPYDAANTYVTPSGSRNCRKCRSIQQREFRERRKNNA